MSRLMRRQEFDVPEFPSFSFQMRADATTGRR